jgi:hypothetical protein
MFFVFVASKGVAVFIAVYRLSSADIKTVVLLRGLIQPMCFASFWLAKRRGYPQNLGYHCWLVDH